MARPQHKTHTLPDSISCIVIGGGAREHALAWRLHRSKSCNAVWTTHPNNPGLKSICRAADFDFSVAEFYRLEQLIRRENINLVVVGPETYLAQGIADKLRPITEETGVQVLAPSADAARIETDKAFAKDLMRQAAIPTAGYRVFKDTRGAIEHLETRETAPVIKAAGLAAGKGVIVPETLDDARSAVMHLAETFPEAARQIIIEDKLEGPEVSVFALVDGANVVILDACQDHKRLLENDQGPNTGGMGAYCPVPQSIAPNETMASVAQEIIIPTLDALRRENIDYRGVLYLGLMLTPAGPKVLEFNARFGDPEAQCLVRRISGDFAKLLYATATGQLDLADFDTNDNHVAAVTLAAPGYPDNPVKGAPIEGIEDAEALPGVTIFHAGTARKDGKLITAGGRVLTVTATATTLAEARDTANNAAELIRFEGKQHRRDIAHQALNPATTPSTP